MFPTRLSWPLASQELYKSGLSVGTEHASWLGVWTVLLGSVLTQSPAHLSYLFKISSGISVVLKNPVSWICPTSPFWKLGSLPEAWQGFYLLCPPQSSRMGFLCSCLQVFWASWDIVCLGMDIIYLKQSSPLLRSLAVDDSFLWVMFSYTSTWKTIHPHFQDTTPRNRKAFRLLPSTRSHLPQVLDLYLLCSMFCFRPSFQNNFALRIFAKPIKWFLGFTIWCMTRNEKKKKKKRTSWKHATWLWFRGIGQKCPLCLHHS